MKVFCDCLIWFWIFKLFFLDRFTVCDTFQVYCYQLRDLVLNCVLAGPLELLLRSSVDERSTHFIVANVVLALNLLHKEEDGPEAELAKLLAGVVGEQNPYTGLTLQNLALHGVPSQQLLQATTLEVKKLLVCGKRKDALKCAQEGELWSIALVVA